MRYQLTALCLAVVLGVLPGLTTIPAAPAPARAKPPDVYALVYVGRGRNNPDTAKWTADLISCLRDSGIHNAIGDPKVRALPIIQNQIRRLGNRELYKWADSKTRFASLEGTAVVRIWFTEGSPEEQALIVNAIIRHEIERMQKHCRDMLEYALRHEREVEAYRAQRGIKVTEKVAEEEERACRRREELFKHPPHVLEWASPPDKP